MSETERLERIQTITKYFPFWQGLRMLPIGMSWVFVAMLLGIGDFVGSMAFALLLIAINTAALLGTVFIQAGYRQKFGIVINSSVYRPLKLMATFVAIPLLVLGIVLDGFLKPPIFISGLLFAGFLVWICSASGGGRPHYLWTAAVVAALSFLPLLGFPFLNFAQALLLVMGVGFVIAGILDHLELTRIFKPIKEETNAPA